MKFRITEDLLEILDKKLYPSSDNKLAIALTLTHFSDPRILELNIIPSPAGVFATRMVSGKLGDLVVLIIFFLLLSLIIYGCFPAGKGDLELSITLGDIKSGDVDEYTIILTGSSTQKQYKIKDQ